VLRFWPADLSLATFFPDDVAGRGVAGGVRPESGALYRFRLRSRSPKKDDDFSQEMY
jgi:hypothetical protein